MYQRETIESRGDDAHVEVTLSGGRHSHACRNRYRGRGRDRDRGREIEGDEGKRVKGSLSGEGGIYEHTLISSETVVVSYKAVGSDSIVAVVVEVVLVVIG